MRLKVPTQSIQLSSRILLNALFGRRDRTTRIQGEPQKLFSLTAPQIFQISSARVCNVCKMLLQNRKTNVLQNSYKASPFISTCEEIKFWHLNKKQRNILFPIAWMKCQVPRLRSSRHSLFR